MGFWENIKQLFLRKNKNTAENNHLGVIAFDTSLAQIPEFDSLNQEAKEEVSNYIQKTKNSSYDELIKYGEHLQEQSGTITELLLNHFYSATQISLSQLSEMSLEDILKSRTNTLIAQVQLSLYQEMFNDLLNEAVLRTIALEEIFKNRKHRFHFIFRSEKEEDYQIKQAIERMKITVINIQQQWQVVSNEIKNSRRYRTIA